MYQFNDIFENKCYCYVNICLGCVLPNETVIAISRARTDQCKREFRDLACGIHAGKVYPLNIQG